MSNTARMAKSQPENHNGKALKVRSDGLTNAPGGRVLGALCAVFLLVLVQPAFAKNDPVPDWVTAAVAQAVPTYPAETNAVVLLDDTTYKVAPDGRAVEHHRRVVKILRPQGRDEADIHVEFDKDTKILSMNVWSIGHD